jgi:hypothetical protein
MPNATAQLMVGPLLMRSVFFFNRGVGADVLRNFFSAEDVLRQQVEAEIKETSITRLQSRSREEMRRRNYSRMVRFFDGRMFSSRDVFPLSAMALGVFSGGGGEGVKCWKCVRVDLQSTGEAILLAVEIVTPQVFN